ncbi:hypothetical protein LSCM1_03815 [Leishmania martiniquensis]|uniref:Uncharacterized protein n=1 Tax=Leishmania martiniquensis TaxID=1580590 RepID=A0A836KFS3_9TRYP|nr:hypothetical protein LSCM1_03815 [Leishmania martiniquensis]
MQQCHRRADKLLLTPRLRRLFARAHERQQLCDHHSFLGSHRRGEPLPWFRAASQPTRALDYLGARERGTLPLAWAPAAFAEEDVAASSQGVRGGRSSAPARPPLAYTRGAPLPWAPDACPPLSFVMNAAFLHETCLFLLLLRHPLPSSSLAGLGSLSEREPLQADGRGAAEAETVQYILKDSRWQSCLPDDVEATWLRAAIPAIDVQMKHSALADPTTGQVQAPADNLGDRGYSREAAIARLCSKDYLEHLIWPTHEAGAVRPELVADCAWVDVASVHSHGLHHYHDAFWVPYSSSHSFAAWHRASLCAARNGESATGDVETRRWVGDLYMCT